MNNLIRLHPTRWPYSLGQLKLDEPFRSFSNAPSDGELAAYDVYPVRPSNQPQYDPEVERVVESLPVLASDYVWEQQWEIVALTAEEQEEYQRIQNPPDWISFAFALPPDISTLLANAFALDPRLHGTLLVGMGQASTGDSRVFLNAWQLARSVGLISAEVIETVQTIGQQYHLPAEFIAALGAELP